MPERAARAAATAANEIAAALAAGNSVSVELPAGCGKTDLLVEVVDSLRTRGQKTLVLTHTHAGVNSILSRLRKKGVPKQTVRVQTIDSWCYGLTSSYPSAADLPRDRVPNWRESSKYHIGAKKILEKTFYEAVLHQSYNGVLVDEYQDCNQSQHQLVLCIKTLVPTAVFGDRVQSIFRFGENVPVGWTADVTPNFPSYDIPIFPWRWHGSNVLLGEWITAQRQVLLEGGAIDLATAPIAWHLRSAEPAEVTAILKRSVQRAIREQVPSIVIGHFRNDCVTTAKRLGGLFKVIEPIRGQDILRAGAKIDRQNGRMKLIELINFIMECSIGLPNVLDSKRRSRIRDGLGITTRTEEHRSLMAAIQEAQNDCSPAQLRRVMREIRKLRGVFIHCLEAYDQIEDGFRLVEEEGMSLCYAIEELRGNLSSASRRIPLMAIGTTLLVKGLEFEHVVVENTGDHTAESLYVALSRATRSVAALGPSPRFDRRLALRSSAAENQFASGSHS